MDTSGNSKSDGKKVARATGTIGGLTLASRILGLLRDMVIASTFGAGFATDAFFAAFKVPNLLRRLVAEGSLATAFVPVFCDELDKSADDGRKAITAVTSFTLLLTVMLTILGIVFADPITHFFAPGFAKKPGKIELARDLLVMMFPYIILVSLLALASSILNTLNRFALPAAAPAVLNVVFIISVLFLAPVLTVPVHSLAWAVLFGGVLALLPQLYLLKRLGFGLGLSNPFKSKAVKTLSLLMLPSVISSSVYQVMVFVNTILASVLDEGSVSWLYYADRLFQFPLGVFTIAVATAVLPTLSRLATEGKNEELGKQLELALGWVSYITVPAAAGLIILAEPIVQVVYERGSFSHAETLTTASALKCYAVGLWAVSCHSILVRAYLAKKNTLTPAIVSCCTIFINIGVALALMGSPKVVEDSVMSNSIASLQNYLSFLALGHNGLALAGSIASFISFFALYALLRRNSIIMSLRALSFSLVKVLICCTVMSAVLQSMTTAITSPLLLILLSIPFAAATYFLATLLLKSGEAQSIYSYLRKR